MYEGDPVTVRLKRVQNQLHWANMKKVAGFSGVDRNYLRRFRDGEVRDPRLSTLDRLERALGGEIEVPDRKKRGGK